MLCVLRFPQTRPVQFAFVECLLSTGIENAVGILLIEEPCKLLAASLSDERREVMPEVAEEREGRCCVPLLAHKQHGRLGREQVEFRCRPHASGRRELTDPFPERSIADLIVVLYERHEGARQQIRARLLL